MTVCTCVRVCLRECARVRARMWELSRRCRHRRTTSNGYARLWSIFIVLSIKLVFMVLGVSYSRVLTQRPTGCCSSSTCKTFIICVSVPTPLFSTRPSDRDQIWHVCADRYGTGSHLKKSDPHHPSGGFRGLFDKILT